ncbi:MAG TPA: hypothetical protein VGG17_11250 [Acidimicrobiales bacterium]|jgi:hypothetical protein
MKKLTSIAAVAVILGTGTLLGAGVASAQGSRGIITGRVMECAPGPVVASPPAPEPKPQPLTVTLYRNGAAYHTKRVVLPERLPWNGTFTFSVPAGRYEVVSSYQHRERWVDLSSGAREVVNFNTLACPL